MASILCCTVWFISTTRPLMRSPSPILRLCRLALFWWFEKPGLWDYLIAHRQSKGWNSRASTMLGERRKLQRAQDGDHTETSLKACLTRTFCPESTKGAACTRPIDRLWALFEMCSDKSILKTEGFPLDYDTPWDDAYRKVSTTLLRLTHTDLLGLERKPMAADYEDDTAISFDIPLPSWTINWAIPLKRPLCGFSEDGLFNAATQLRATLIEPEHCFGHQTPISINGYCIDTVHTLGSIFGTSKADDELDYIEANEYLKKIETFVDRSTLIPSPSKADAKARIPVHDLEYNYFGVSRRAKSTSVMRGYNEMKTCAAEGQGPILFIGQDFLSYKALLERCLGKRPFITTRGYVGACTAGAEAGDVLGAIAGAPGLIILRPFGNGKDRGVDANSFTVVGEAYAYGLMDGEIGKMEDVNERRLGLY